MDDDLWIDPASYPAILAAFRAQQRQKRENPAPPCQACGKGPQMRLFGLPVILESRGAVCEECFTA